MQVLPRDTLSVIEKRNALRDIANYQNRLNCSLADACTDLRRSINDVRRWQKEIGVIDAQQSLRKAVSLFDNGIDLHAAARRSCVTEIALTRALKARGRRPSSTPHVGIHNRGFSPASY